MRCYVDYASRYQMSLFFALVVIGLFAGNAAKYLIARINLTKTKTRIYYNKIMIRIKIIIQVNKNKKRKKQTVVLVAIVPF